jgi:hypothetical protein
MSIMPPRIDHEIYEESEAAVPKARKVEKTMKHATEA